MTDHREQLRETFEAHEHLAPDPAAVYARVQELARVHRRRRRGAQVAGGAVLGAGLLAGAISLPGLLPGQQPQTTFPLAAPAPASPSASTPPTQAELDRWWQAYFGAGYDYDDAVKLAAIWKSSDDIGTVKAEAGRRLLAGEPMPFPPGPKESPAEEPSPDPTVNAALEKFFNAGYTWDEAERLAELWKLADPYEAKIEGGERLLAGQKLPIRPKPANVAAAKDNQRFAAFFDAGYDYDDAVKLAGIWKLDDPGQAKLEGGKRLLAGRKLPIEP